MAEFECTVCGRCCMGMGRYVKVTGVMGPDKYAAIHGISNETFYPVVLKAFRGDFDIDKKIYVDDVLLKESDYVCENGSLIAKLHDSLLNSLSVGNHTLKVVFTDGEVSAPFIVKEREKPSTPSYIPPKTGDQ